jgi:hypothetical protein
MQIVVQQAHSRQNHLQMLSYTPVDVIECSGRAVVGEDLQVLPHQTATVQDESGSPVTYREKKCNFIFAEDNRILF